MDDVELYEEVFITSKRIVNKDFFILNSLNPYILEKAQLFAFVCKFTKKKYLHSIHSQLIWSKLNETINVRNDSEYMCELIMKEIKNDHEEEEECLSSDLSWSSISSSDDE